MAVIKVEMPPLHAADSGVGGGTATSTTSSTSGSNSNNNTISAAADSSDNQPSTPQPVGANEQQHQTQSQQQQQQSQTQSHHPYATHHMYASAATAANSGNMPHMYAGMYGTAAGVDLQQQQQLSSGYPSYLNSYEPTYYQQPPTTLAAMDYGNVGGSSSSATTASLLYGSSTAGDYKPLQSSVRYHPYLHTPTSGLHTSSASSSAIAATNGSHQQLIGHSSSSIVSPQQLDEQSATATPNSATNAAVSTTSSLSPRVVSSSSPSSTSQQQHQQQQQQHTTSPGCTQIQCKKCGILCTNEAELSAHFANVHAGASSPFAGIGGYSSGQPPTQQQQTGGNPGEILDLDSQKMVYPPTPGEYSQMHGAVSSDPLHSMHSMQQRAIANWEQPTQQPEGMPPYMQPEQKSSVTATAQPSLANQSPYYSPKQSPYHTIKSEFPVIKSEYAADSQNYVDKSFDPTIANEISCQQQQQQPLMPVSSSPAEFPSTTTTTQQDQQQQQQYRAQFEPPTSSSVLPASSITAKAATWKSNEARRPKTYNCTACNKWFTSSGHLKRHYNTTLHKNAVKSSGQPDPATLPISAHHHPTRDPTTKQSRRSKADVAAAREQQQQAQAPVPVQPPEPPRSPPEYASSQSAGLASLSHYSTSPSPTHHSQVNGMSYAQSQQQQNGANNNTFQQQYLQQVQATATNTAVVSNTTVLNGHPNGLAGPSVHQQQTLTSSKMRGLLNSTTTIVTKSEQMEDQQHHSPMDMHMEMELSEEQQQQQQQDHQHMQLAEMEEVLEQQQQAYQLELEQQRPHHSNTPSSTHSSSTPSMRPQSPHTIFHHQYLEQLHQQQMEDNIFCHTPPTPGSTHMQPQQQHNIMVDQQQYSITVLDTNTTQQQLPPLQQQQHNNNNMSPPLQHTTTATTNSMGSIHTMQHSQQLQQQHHPHIMHSTLLNSTSNTLEQLQPLDIMHNTIHTLTTTPNTMPIHSFQQLQQQEEQAAALLGPEHTMSYHTIIGNGDELHAGDQQLLQLSSSFDQYPQMLTSDGQLVQLIPAQQLLGPSIYRVGTVTDSYAPLTPYSAQRSPQEADLPPIEDDMQAHESSSSALNGGVQVNSPIGTTNSTQAPQYTQHSKTLMLHAESVIVAAPKTQAAVAKPKRNTGGGNIGNATTVKRKRNTSASSQPPASSVLPSGRIQCQQCDKTFTKNCYLTQHINCFHAGEYPFRCEKCGKRFQLSEPYELHLLRHMSSEKAHKCHLCPKHYHHKTDLRRHIEGNHTQKKPHSCEICDKSFCRYDHLMKHMDTHNRPRVVGKRAAATNKIKASFESAAKTIANSNDNIASSIDSVVSNNSNFEDMRHYTAVVQSVQLSHEHNVGHADVVSSDDSDKQKMTIHTETSVENELLNENEEDISGESYMLDSGMVIKQEYHMVEQEIPIY